MKINETGNKKKTIKYIGLLVLIAILVTLFDFSAFSLGTSSESVMAADKESSMIRVGLEAIYYNKQSITVRNSDIVIGYSVNDVYYKEMALSGGTYTITPYTGQIKSSGSYTTYEEAKAAVQTLKNNGTDAYPMLTGLNKWTVGVCNSGDKDNYAVLVSGEKGDKFIYTAANGAYPQISAGKADGSGVYRVDLGERQYRGRIEIGRYGGAASLKVVNIVELEEYLYGVVPCEMVSSWHAEAIKAQAVCARSYAYVAGFGADTNLSNPYTLCDTTSSQVYKGYGAEKASTNNAVDETKGKIIYYNGNPVKAYYCSTSGGSTENVEDVWGSPYGYLRQVSDIYELNPELEPWIIEFSADEVESILEDNGINIGSVKNIHPFVMTASGRVYSVKIVGDSYYVLTGERLRKIFSLYSTKYKVVKYGDNPDYVSVITANGKSAVDIGSSYIVNGNYTVKKASDDIEQYVVMTADNLINYPAQAPTDSDTYYIAGMGYGHGVGMSQSGAKGMAEAGFGYEQILKHYYTGIEVR